MASRRGAGRPHPLRAAAAVAIARARRLRCCCRRAAPGRGSARRCAVLLGLLRLARRQLGGYTGDVLGAAQQLAEIGFLLGVLLLPSPG